MDMAQMKEMCKVFADAAENFKRCSEQIKMNLAFKQKKLITFPRKKMSVLMLPLIRLRANMTVNLTDEGFT